MDILNFISWIRGGRVVTTVNPAQTLLPVGLKDNRRDDGYLAGAISVEDLVTQLTPTPTYKVFTALLTQSGGSDIRGFYNGGDPLTIGMTYQIIDNGGSGWDFTNIGAPNNDLGTYFIATGITPNSWGIDGQLEGNTGAPVATVLENTIGNVWFSYNDVGFYDCNSNGLFTLNKEYIVINKSGDEGSFNKNAITFNYDDTNRIGIITGFNGEILSNDILFNYPIEIRVYN